VFLTADGTIIASPTDLAVAVACEFALLRRLDVKLGRAVAVTVEDPLMARAAVLGDVYEKRVLEQYRQRLGDGVIELTSQPSRSQAELVAARDLTLEHLRGGAPLVYQGAFFDGRLSGRSDFLELRYDGYAVLDTKLARHAKVAALLQLAAYADQLLRADIPLHPKVGLILGNGAQPEYDVDELLAVYRHRRGRMEELLDGHLAGDAPADWQQTNSCGRCDDCSAEVTRTRDALLVHGLRVTQRAHLHQAGVTTVEDLATSTGPVPGVGSATLDRLRQQARMQSGQDNRPLLPDGQPDVHVEVVDEAVLRALPAPDDGDLFFDFEGDPLWDNGDGKGGLEYLFGVVEADTGAYVKWTADTREEEHAALRSFLDYVVKRRTAHPTLRIYHYAPYERTALARLAGYASYGEDVVDDLLRKGVLVDLYAAVRAAVRISQPSYSIKKLEPLYMGGQHRQGVSGGGESVEMYGLYTKMREEGSDEAQAVLNDILDYNEYDCRSTLALRDWLRGLVGDPASTTGPPVEPPEAEAPGSEPEPVADSLADHLREQANTLGAGHPDAGALRLLAACLGYHQREDKPVWWEHYARLRDPIEDWGGNRDVLVVEELLQDSGWTPPIGRRASRRTVTLAGTWGTGSTPGADATAVFAEPVPIGLQVPADGCRAAGPSCAIRCSVDDQGRDVVTVELPLKKDQAEYGSVPVALVPGGPLGTTRIQQALRELGEHARTDLPAQPGTALLKREPLPALPAAASADRLIETVTEAVRRRAGSFVAVQGPPGTGKTYLGARVVKALVDEGWRVGVVAQSHSVVAHFLDAVVEAGVPADQVAKKAGDATGAWASLKDTRMARFLADHADRGCVLGGTTWDMTHVDRVARGGLDLLVVDEAGQYSLANTLAVSVSAKRLLLLGDPQQLPQVSKGTHPEPVDTSALTWLMDGAATMPPDRGYFLPQTWRMHPTLTAKVSELSYAGRLQSESGVADRRRLDGVKPGLHVRPVEHQGNDTSSPQEAAEVVSCLRSVIGLPWTPDDGPTRPLTATDVLVVAAYNAQVKEVRRQLAAAGLADVQVGTVDKLQGREAAVVCVTLAASSAADVPRGMEFLLSRNRLNVAVSRAQWAAFVVHSPALADHLPTNPADLIGLGAYLRLLAP